MLAPNLSGKAEAAETDRRPPGRHCSHAFLPKEISRVTVIQAQTPKVSVGIVATAGRAGTMVSNKIRIQGTHGDL